MVHNIIIKKEITTNILVDLLSMAFSGGIGYWCSLVDYDEDEYKASKEKIKAEGIAEPCWEDVLVQMLEDGKSIIIVDDEEDERYKLTLNKLLNGIELNYRHRPHDCDIEEGDAETADCIIQYALFYDVIYG